MLPSSHRPSIALVTTTLYPVEVFLLDQIRQMSRQYDVTLLTNTTDLKFFATRGIDAWIMSAPIQRKISVFHDLKALVFLLRALRGKRFDVVHSVTPKAGLLGMLAARLAGVPTRIHTFTGQVWDQRSGLMRSIIKGADKVTSMLATHILVDGFAQREFIIKEGVVSSDKSYVLANGSLSGVDTFRFAPDQGSRARIRAKHGIADDGLLFLFLARLTRDKGALVMAEGFAKYCQSGGPDAHLLVVGPDEENLRPTIVRICGIHASRVRFVDYTTIPEQYMAAADVYCLPSYREGFGTALINAAATGIPAIASRIRGSEEAIVENDTGLLHAAGNVDELTRHMRTLASDPAMRARLGLAGRIRAQRDFSEAAVTSAVLEFYKSTMQLPLDRGS